MTISLEGCFPGWDALLAVMCICVACDVVTQCTACCDTPPYCRGAVRESLHGDKLKRKQRELRSWAEGAASLHVLNQLDTTVDQFLQVVLKLRHVQMAHATAGNFWLMHKLDAAMM